MIGWVWSQTSSTGSVGFAALEAQASHMTALRHSESTVTAVPATGTVRTFHRPHSGAHTPALTCLLYAHTAATHQYPGPCSGTTLHMAEHVKNLPQTRHTHRLRGTNIVHSNLTARQVTIYSLGQLQDLFRN